MAAERRCEQSLEGSRGIANGERQLSSNGCHNLTSYRTKAVFTLP